MAQLGLLSISVVLIGLPFLVLNLLKKRNVRLAYTISGAVYGALVIPYFFVGYFLSLVFPVVGCLLTAVLLPSYLIGLVVEVLTGGATVRSANEGLSFMDWTLVLPLIIVCGLIGAVIDWCRAPWRTVRPRAS